MCRVLPPDRRGQPAKQRLARRQKRSLADLLPRGGAQPEGFRDCRTSGEHSPLRSHASPLLFTGLDEEFATFEPATGFHVGLEIQSERDQPAEQNHTGDEHHDC